MQEALANNDLIKRAALIPTRTDVYTISHCHAQITTDHRILFVTDHLV